MLSFKSVPTPPPILPFLGVWIKVYPDGVSAEVMSLSSYSAESHVSVSANKSRLFSTTKSWSSIALFLTERQLRDPIFSA